MTDKPEPDVEPPPAPAPEGPVLDLGAAAFVIGLLVLGLLLMLTMVRR